MNADDAPWEPPELALRVGAVVTIRLSPECRGLHGPYGHLDHDTDADGGTGEIIAVLPDYADDGHPYNVQWSNLLPMRTGYGRFARAELERL